MRKLYLLVGFALTGTTVFGQTTIQGVLKDSVAHETEPYATVRVFRPDNLTKPVAMSVTDKDGKFHQFVSGKGEYIVSLASVGKKEVRRSLTLQGQSVYNLGTVYTVDDAGQLKGVEIVAQKPIVQMTTDKMSYQVSDDADAQTMTVLDMLRKVPMVTVDAQDNITVNGSSSFKILVDGKPNIQLDNNAKQILKAIPASVVEKIEVITNPGAKYDAEGVNGVLDIRLKHTSHQAQNALQKGYNGQVKTVIGNKSERLNASVSGQQGKFNYSVYAYGGYNKFNHLDILQQQKSIAPEGSSMITTSGRANQYSSYNGADLSMGVELDSMSQLDASVGYNYYREHVPTYMTRTYTGTGYGSEGASYDFNSPHTYRSFGIDASADYQHFFNKERSKSITVSYLFSNNPSHMRQYDQYHSSSSLIGNRLWDYSNEHTRGTEHTFQIDYTTPLGKNQTLNVGSKFITRSNKSDSRYLSITGSIDENPTPDLYIQPETSGHQFQEMEMDQLYFNHQYIGAAYAEYEATFGKWNTRAGLRYEKTWTDIKYPLSAEENFKKNYGNLIPTVSLGYKLSDMTNIGVNYKIGILRPGISYLNPYRNMTDPTNISYGNPDLNVEKTHVVGMVFNHYETKFMMNATLQQSFCSNEIYQYSFRDAAGILNTTYGHVVKNRWTNLSTWMRWVVGKKTSVSLNGYLGYGDMRSSILHGHSHGWQSNGTFMLEQTLPAAIKWNLGLQASTRRYSLQGYSNGFNMLFTTLTRSFCKEKFDVSLLYFSPFSGKLKQKTYSHGVDFENGQTVSIPLQVVRVSFVWHFGNTKKHFVQHESKISNDFGEQSKNKINTPAGS